jgi:hypothetical protein
MQKEENLNPKRVTDKLRGRRKYLQRGGRRRFHNKIVDMEIMIDSPATTWWRTFVQYMGSLP